MRKSPGLPGFFFSAKFPQEKFSRLLPLTLMHHALSLRIQCGG